MVDHAIIITLDAHAVRRSEDRGTNESEIREAVSFGESFSAKRGRTEFRAIFRYEAFWEGVFYRNKQLHVFAAKQQHGWHVITVIVKFF